MPPLRSSYGSTRLFYTLFGALNAYFRPARHVLAKREAGFDPHSKRDIVFAVLIPVLVLLSGLFAGLTLGYMSLDQTQLNVLALSGTPEQRKYAQKIIPVRKNGHLLLVTLLLANMIVNESLPIFADKVLGGGVQAVVVSTVLIIIFSEIVPQSLFTRHGLYLGAKGAPLTQCLIYALGIISWPVAKLLEFVLGQHHGIIYRRTELKELIAMHSDTKQHGGDLQVDTVTIIGATLDLQEKTVKDAMTPIEDVFMLDIESRLDYELLKQVVATGHSRIPVYEEVDAPVTVLVADASSTKQSELPKKVKKILGILLVKQLVLLDPKDAVPLRTVPLNMVPFVPNNQSLLGILDKFQEGRSHIAIVSRFSVEKARSVKKAVKRGLTQRLREKVGISDSDSESDSDNEITKKGSADGSTKEEAKNTKSSAEDVVVKDYGADPEKGVTVHLEQSMPADAVLGKADANEFLQGLDPAVMPLGIISLEDVLEELIGEEIFDEFDEEGANFQHHSTTKDKHPAGLLTSGRNFFRSRSVPVVQRNANDTTAPSALTAEPGEPTTAPRPEAANNNASLAPPNDVSLEALLRAGAGRRAARVPATPRGRFKSSPLGDTGDVPEPAATAAAIPIEQRTDTLLADATSLATTPKPDS
ncbi:CNNM transmembrane domain-containing protein [Mycena indigotica]|uniref:CNNM transmembrane domain-containing protein n=1 Tax=Mycena indigotica TaxID=2126181 RepID=A0A8H6TEH4_9AGAR|nr:CNNM transmembrane domain-containing protein [Mycena indigotica]KAF7315277.1 CNNM transmembrane domain-containing protein [Mycena indigotica]